MSIAHYSKCCVKILAEDMGWLIQQWYSWCFLRPWFQMWTTLPNQSQLIWVCLPITFTLKTTGLNFRKTAVRIKWYIGNPPIWEWRVATHSLAIHWMCIRCSRLLVYSSLINYACGMFIPSSVYSNLNEVTGNILLVPWRLSTTLYSSTPGTASL
jgi:hypothetical protein